MLFASKIKPIGDVMPFLNALLCPEYLLDSADCIH